jgi:hypothetical protein
LYFTYQLSITPDVIKKEYVGLFTFPGPGTYNINYVDTFRIGGIENISDSGFETITIEHSHLISPFLGENNTPVLFSYQTDISVSNNIYGYYPNAWDPDGDSLTYEIIPCTASNYIQPDSLIIDPVTGKIDFYPDSTGMYAIAFKIKEWRYDGTQYYLMGSSTKDLLIDVYVLNSMSDLQKNEQFVVFPNPSNGLFSISNLGSGSIKDYSAQLFDISGKLIRTFDFNSEYHLNLMDYPGGLYYLRIVDSNQAWNYKLLKE